MWNVPNSLTLLRILLIPVFIGILYAPDTWLTMHEKNLVATVIFALAAITDWLDGYFARILNQSSAFGAFLDPVADKLMVAAALVMLIELGRVGAFVTFIIIGREIAISALREWMAGIGERGSVAVAYIGKVKTAVQMIAILFLLYHDSLDLGMGEINIQFIGRVLIVIAANLTLLSMAYYLKAAWPSMKAK
ncbi:MAG TPA: CDP-diacylglycerol--glycerol-3-phosphate 3-phosphatidyltransferase [Methylophilaceae bacterium]|jgi:CDP-diacylglycerol--glycerol-3-phosphate 3-phosphatidyltransferase/cardiolipin synthase